MDYHAPARSRWRSLRRPEAGVSHPLPGGLPERIRSCHMSRNVDGISPADRKQSGQIAPEPRFSGTRETIESLVVAIILAFLFRGFVAEAFVIPTGSMATTLYGRHNDVACQQCGYAYQTGASAENEDRRSGEVLATTCPVCRFTMELDKRNDANQRSFDGDRILVSKFDYDLAPPQRWDVFVFKYPANAKQNYIKRLVGLPNEELKIRHGDVYTRPYDGTPSSPDGAAAWRIQRKPAHKVRAMMQLVHDTENRPEKLAKVHWPARWQRWSADRGWPDRLAECSVSGELPPLDAREGEQWLRYRHYVPRPDDWYYIGEKRQLPPGMLFMRPGPAGSDEQLRIGYQVSALGDIARSLGRRLKQAGFQISVDSQPLPLEARRAAARQARVPFLIDIVPGAAGVPTVALSVPSDAQELIRWGNEIETIVEDLHRLILPQRRHGALITDFYAYNAYHLHLPRTDGFMRGFADVRKSSGFHWVGDLVVECNLKLIDGSGQLQLLLVEGGVQYGCSIDIAKQTATLSINGGAGRFGDPPTDHVKTPSAQLTPSIQPGRFFRLRFANVDSQLLLWVNDKLVRFDATTEFQPFDEVVPRWSEQDPGDAAPVAVGGQGVHLQFDQLRVLRDVYYVAQGQSRFPISQHEYRFRGVDSPALDSDRISQLLARPPEWSDTHLFRSRDEVTFLLGEDQFFPMGDNSPESLDGRLWEDCPKSVDRELLLGKALLIYWPHAWRSNFSLPIPNLRRMGLIR